jgi:hypothetical protein
MMGEVSWDPKRRRLLASWYSILSGKSNTDGEGKIWEVYQKMEGEGGAKDSARIGVVKM